MTIEDPFASLPVARREAMRSALRAAFGAARIDAIAPIGGGASGALPYRVAIGGRRYLVRLEGPPSPLRNPHQYEAMRIAARAGIAPKIHHIDEATRIAIMDFIDEQPSSAFPGGPYALAQAIGKLLARVQATPPFPRFVEYPNIVGRLWAWVRQTGLFAPGILDPHTEHLARIRARYVWDPKDSVSSHNDPVPRNILFDGERLWLIDWESAYRNDPLVDVAIALDNFAPSAELEDCLLRAWLGRPPDASLFARLDDIRALTRLYYASVLLSASAAALGRLADRDLAVPTVQEFRRAIRDGEIEPGAAGTKHILGKMYLASFLTGEAPPGLDGAV
jgi:aminoglycoside phosphotransferase (APT) family kinase protein